MTDSEKESIYLLQRIDCNCNNCGFMVRDMDRFQKWFDWHRANELAAFEIRKKRAIDSAKAVEDTKQSEAMLFKAGKMKFIFARDKLIQYGHCAKFNKQVSFIPDTCQVETQFCFVHRNDYVHDSPTTPR